MLFVAELMNSAVVFPLKNTIMKLTIWEINKGMVTIKVDTQVSSMVLTIINKDNRDLIQATNTTKTRVDLQTSHHNKGQIFIRGLLSWMILSLNLCKLQCLTIRARSQPSRTLRSRWDS